MNCSYKILNVEIVSGNELCSYWKSDMQEITTDKGKFIDNLAVKGGYDWKQEVGKTVYATVNKSKGYNWLSMEKHQSIQNNEIHIATKNGEIQEEKLPKDYNLNDNPELKQTYEYIKQDIPVIFLTGGAGTGKSTFIKYLKNNLKKDAGKNCVVLAPTGVAAINAGGQTIHSFFHWNTDVFEDEEVTIGKYRNPIVDHTDLFIIDEVSMVHSWMIDHIDYALRLWCDKTKPFGGKQMLLIGDCFQLPPVMNSDDEDKKKFYDRWESPFFFAAKTFTNCSSEDIKSLQLKKIYRQEKDQHFIHILNRIRKCKHGYESDIEFLNANCFIETRLETKNVPEECLLLCTMNARADEFNNKRMLNLKNHGAKSITFNAIVEGDFKQDSVLTPTNLEICIGAKIMVTKNISSNGLVNGDMGKVLGFGGTGNNSDDYVDIEVKGNSHRLMRETWQSLKYEWNERAQTIAQSIVGTFNQIPLKLGWAVTIHKSQGLTLDSVAIDAPDAWDSGQVYVALSRAKNLNGVLLCQKLPVSAVKVDKYVQEKYRELFPDDEDESSEDIDNDYKAVFSNDNFTIDKSKEISSVVISGTEIELYPSNGEKIQDHVIKTLPQLIEKKIIPDAEMNRLLTDKEYCYHTFGICFDFKTFIAKFTLLRKLEEGRLDDYEKQRYWTTKHTNYDKYLICSQWYPNCANKFAHWLIKLSTGSIV